MSQPTTSRPGPHRLVTVRRRAERGELPVGYAFVLPLLLLVVFWGTQAGLWFFARSVAHAAAQQGARAAAAHGAALQDGLDLAHQFAGEVGGGLVSNVTVTGTRTATGVEVTVTTDSLRLVPGLPLTVAQRASLPVERYTRP